MSSLASKPQPKRVKHKAPKAAFSFKRQVLPPVLGISMMLCVFGLLNGQYLIAQARYRFDKPAAVPVAHVQKTDATKPPTEASTKIDPTIAPAISIPAIDVKAPIVVDEKSYVEWKVQLALRQGVVHYGQTAMPGQKGNMVILGHSSGQLWAPGGYKFVFTLLEKLKAGDNITIDYQGTRYTYQVTDSKVVTPDDLSILDQTSQPTLSLVTCTPVGTSKNRLVVHAKQISPKPITDHAVSKSTTPVTATKLPGSDNSTSLWQRVREAL
jgi:sortase A